MRERLLQLSLGSGLNAPLISVPPINHRFDAITLHMKRDSRSGHYVQRTGVAIGVIATPLRPAKRADDFREARSDSERRILEIAVI
jgi:hypothetical protein